MLCFFTFLKPYWYISLISSYGVSQNLEGIGWFGYFNNIYNPNFPYPLLNLSPDKGVNTIAGMIFLLLATLALLFIRGCFILGKKPGLVSIVAVFSPGILSSLKISPAFTDFLPDEFHLGSGYIGGFWSSGVNFVIALMYGWSITLIVANLFKSQKFKHIYDHLWCLLSLVGCMYLVVDSQTKSDERQMADTNKLIGEYLEYYEQQYSELNRYCLSNTYFFSKEEVICKSGIKTYMTLSQEDHQEEPELRRYGNSWIKSLPSSVDLDRLNSYFCSTADQAVKCKETPLNLMLSNQELGSKILLPLFAHGQRLDKLYKKLGKLADKAKSAKEGINLKFFLFCLISFLAGGKAATASLSIIGESNMKSRSWLRYGISVLFFNIWFLSRRHSNVLRPYHSTHCPLTIGI